MKLKLDADGKPVLTDGKPVYVHDDGKEFVADVPDMYSRLTRDGSQNAALRRDLDAANQRLRNFEGIDDPVAAKKALETVKNLDEKKLIDAGQVEIVKNEAIKAVRAEYDPIKAKAESLERELYGERIGGSFARSKVIQDKFAIPADLVQARFGSHFKIEEGKTVAYDAAGNKIFSRSQPGELAGFDEALEVLVDQYPYKSQILKGSGASGAGASGGGGQGQGGKRQISRAEFDKLPPAEKAAASRDPKVELVD